MFKHQMMRKATTCLKVNLDWLLQLRLLWKKINFQHLYWWRCKLRLWRKSDTGVRLDDPEMTPMTLK